MAETRPMVNVYEDGELVYREMTDDEYAQWQTDQQAAAVAAVTAARATLLDQALAALADSDHWWPRALEDGTVGSNGKPTLPPARVAYRDELRAIVKQLQNGADPSTINLPAMPQWEPPLPQ